MATFREFCDGVISAMPRATGREKEEVRLELTDHLLEHRDMLVEHGVEIMEAERRAVEAMGDAAEIGRAWNDKLSPFWLWLGRLCMAAFLLLAVTHVDSLFHFVDSIENRLEVRYGQDAGESFRDMDGYERIWSEDPGVKENFGEHIIRVHRLELFRATGEQAKERGEYMLRVSYVSYPQDFFGYSMNYNALDAVQYSAGVKDLGGGAAQTAYAAWAQSHLVVEEGLERITATLDYHGKTFTAELELDWGGAAA